MGRAVAAVSRAWPAEPWEDPACFALPQAAAVRCSAWRASRALRLGLLCLVLRLRDCARREPRGLPWHAFGVPGLHCRGRALDSHSISKTNSVFVNFQGSLSTFGARAPRSMRAEGFSRSLSLPLVVPLPLARRPSLSR